MLFRSLLESENSDNSGTAFVVVDSKGENAISVIPGANHSLTIEQIESSIADFLPDVILLQAEINVDVLKEVLRKYSTKSRVIFNLAPFINIPKDLVVNCNPLIVNELEAQELLGIEIKENYEEISNIF